MPRNLRLRRDTLAPLATAELRAVAGGYTTNCTGLFRTLPVAECLSDMLCPITGEDNTHVCSGSC